MRLVLDTGALAGIERHDRRVGAILRRAQAERIPVSTSAGALAQCWRDGARQAALARALNGIDVVALDDAQARRVGTTLLQSGTSDVDDAHIACIANAADQVLTSDPDDLQHLLNARGSAATVIAI